MKFNVKIVRLGEYLEKYNILLGKSSVISNEDANEIKLIANRINSLNRYPILLTDGINILGDGKPQQFIIGSLSVDGNNVGISLKTSTKEELYSFALVYTQSTQNYELSLTEM